MEDLKKRVPSAYAKIKGAPQYSNIKGNIYLYSTYGGTVLVVEVYGIPKEIEDEARGFLGLHIHEGDACTGNAEDIFADAGTHFNPGNEQHPLHAGDLPCLLVKGGAAWMAVYTGRFYPEDVTRKTVIIHSMPDDFHSQPSGDSGEKIACGEIVSREEGYH